jgi:hypothetical protein
LLLCIKYVCYFIKLKKSLFHENSLLKDLVIIQITMSRLNYLNCTNSLIKNKEKFELSQIWIGQKWLSSKLWFARKFDEWVQQIMPNNSSCWKVCIKIIFEHTLFI